MNGANILLGTLIVAILACHAAYAALGGLLSPPTDILESAPALFAQSHIVLSFGALACFLTRRWGWRWLAALLGVYALGLGVESLGMRWELPFGAYSFTTLLGPRLGGVPVLIPLSWFNIAWPAWALAQAVFPGRTAARALLTACLMVAWDLSIDPVMSHLFPFWTWSGGGVYYGIPASNLAGWFLVGCAASLLLDRASASIEPSPMDLRWLAAHYAVSVLMPLGLATISGLWLAVAASLAAFWIISSVLAPELQPSRPLEQQP